MTLRSIAVTCAATSGGTTCLHEGLVLNTWLPSRSRTFEIANGSQCLPPFASVEYPEAISSGLVPTPVPSVSEHTGCMSLRGIPIAAAVLRTFNGPTSRMSCANTTFTECVVASQRFM